jgi:hypothetical protein
MIYVLFYFASNYVGKHRTKKGKNINFISLPDIIQNNTPDWSRYHKWIDYYIILFMITSFIVIIWRGNLNLLFKTLIFLAVIFGVKELFSNVTILPDSSKCCETKNKWKIMGNCHNLVYSGHIASMLAIVYVISVLVKKKWASLLYIQTIIYAFFIVASRNHYAIDVLVSFVVVDVLWLRVFLKYIL